MRKLINNKRMKMKIAYSLPALLFLVIISCSKETTKDDAGPIYSLS